MDLENEAILHNRYKILETLGKGGMGAVYRALDESLGVQVAVKENLIDDEEASRQFQREATILAKLRHQNLPRVTDHFVIQGQGQYLVMDFVDGEDLRHRMEREGALPEKEVLLMGIAICDALFYLHTLSPPVIHRDIKPGNIRIAPHGQVYLVDFGLAKTFQASQETTSGARGLTPGYSPPEQYGSARTDARSDIYALGATLYAALTGFPPEDGLSVAINQTQLTRLREKNPKITRKTAAAIEKALSVDPEDRYQSALDFRTALMDASDTVNRQVAIGDVTITPPPPETYEQTLTGQGTLPAIPAAKPTTASRKKRRWLRAFITLILVGAVAAAGVLFGPDLIVSLSPPASPTSTQPATNTETLPTLTPLLTDTAIAELTQLAGAIPTDTYTPEPTFTPTLTPTLGPTPMGGGAQIAFASDRGGSTQIWLKDLITGELTQITDITGGACQPTWSPDGSRLAFITPCSKNQASYTGTGIYMINVDGSGLTKLVSSILGDYDPDWHPSEDKIVFTTLREDNRPQLYLYDIETGITTPLSNAAVADFQPAWSPDGKYIVFTTTRFGREELWFMEASGRPWAEFSRGAGVRSYDPVWSPDGTLIVYTQVAVSGGLTRLMAAPWAEGGSERGYHEFRVTNNTAAMKEAEFSLDGNWIVFTSNPEGPNHDIFIMRADGLEIQRITTDKALDFDPVWRPLILP